MINMYKQYRDNEYIINEIYAIKTPVAIVAIYIQLSLSPKQFCRCNTLLQKGKF